LLRPQDLSVRAFLDGPGLTWGSGSATLKVAAVLRRGGGGSLHPKSARRGADIPFEG